jgi:16S rRNA (cytosine967-C5)-methyltransferase
VAAALTENTIDENILIANFLCEKKSEVIENIKPEWNEHIEATLIDKNDIIGGQFHENKMISFSSELSKGIDSNLFALSFLTQPDLFIRIRPGHKINVMGKLSDSFIAYNLLGGSCLAFPNGTKLDEILKVGSEVIIQDYNSQQIGVILEKYIKNQNASIWDCCAASGGKSIMMYDLNNKINLTVSDIRQSILDNLTERFALAGIKNYESKLIDLTQNEDIDLSPNFDIIVADVPCTGSGTWARTPEQNYFFYQNKIADYANLQYDIVTNSLSKLKKEGILIYITCSVFKNENENQVSKIAKNHAMEVLSQQLLTGYEQKADSMFVAVLKKK